MDDEMDIEKILGDEDSEAAPVASEPVKKQKKPKAEKVEIEVEAEDEVKDKAIVDIDPEAQRLDPEDFEESGGKKVVDTIPVRKPPEQSFFRTHPTIWYRTGTVTLLDGFDKVEYMVAPEIKDQIGSDFKAVTLVLWITRNGGVGLWPLKPGKVGKAGKKNTWYTSGLAAAERAKHVWVRAVPIRGGSGYDRYEATVKIPEPQWPAWDLKTVLDMAFKDYYIDTMNHPVLRMLRDGEGE